MIHARNDYNRIQDPGLENPDLISNGSTPIAADEPVFLLRAQDRTAAEVVRYWAQCQQQLSDHDANAVKLAREHAHRMEQWPKHKTADV
jgi:hypothetical protein